MFSATPPHSGVDLATQVVNASLTLTLSAGNTIENVIGGALGDTLTGNAPEQRVRGRSAATHTLTSGAGNDTYRFDTDNALGSDTDQRVRRRRRHARLLGHHHPRRDRRPRHHGGAGRQRGADPDPLGRRHDRERHRRRPGRHLTGNALNNVIEGLGGNDTLTGGAGNDTYRFDTDNALGSDTIDESGGGIDTLDFSATTTRAVAVDLANAAAQVVNAGLTLTLSAGDTIENVIGGALGDTLTGNALNNALAGGAGNDTLTAVRGRIRSTAALGRMWGSTARS